MKKTKFSIIVPVYDSEKTLERCLKSIAKQSFQDYEVILIDDGSTDLSGKICDKFAVYDPRFHVIHKENEGVSATRNRGIDEATGEYLLFIDSDDTVLEDYLEQYELILRESKYDAVIGGHLKIGISGMAYRIPGQTGEYQNNIWECICRSFENFGYICSKVFRLDIIKHNKIYFRTDMYSQEDLEFCLSVYENCNVFWLTDYAGYEYYYVQGKRKPPIWDFVNNQLKLIRIAENKCELTNVSKKQVLMRIQLLVYSFFYGAENKQEFNSCVGKLNSVNGLKQYLYKTKVDSEKALIARLYANGCYKRIFVYFRLRNMIRNVIKILGK